jgi:hypothetical protein
MPCTTKLGSFRRVSFLSASLCAFLCWSLPLRADLINGIDWFEVDDDNTTVASGSIETDGFDGGGGDKTDNNWDYTTPFGVIGPGDSDERTTSNGTGMLANNIDEDPGKLTVSFAGILQPSTTYTVYVAFRGASDQEGVEVSLNDLDYVQHTRNGADTDLDDVFDTTDTTILGSDDGGAGNPYYYIDDGIGTVSGVSDLTVYFREPTTDIPGSSNNGFSWSIIDAIGLDPSPSVIPEPSSLLLLALVGLLGVRGVVSMRGR